MDFINKYFNLTKNIIISLAFYAAANPDNYYLEKCKKTVFFPKSERLSICQLVLDHATSRDHLEKITLDNPYPYFA